MKIILLADKEQKEELIPMEQAITAGLVWSDDPSSIKNSTGADACIDLLFNSTEERVRDLKNLGAKLIIVNAVTWQPAKIDFGIVRMNGWSTFLKGSAIEVSANDDLKEDVESVFLAINKKVEWVTGITGFISPRVIASIINEAYFALGEGVSTKDEIDVAMKLGTNYPYGPFEWGRKIGIKNVRALLETLASEEKKYKPSAGLIGEASV